MEVRVVNTFFITNKNICTYLWHCFESVHSLWSCAHLYFGSRA